MMNLKSMRSRAAPPGPPVTQMVVRYYLGSTPQDILVPDDTTTIPFPDGPMQYHILTAVGGDPPPLYWTIGGGGWAETTGDVGGDNFFRSLYTDVANLGGFLATIPRLNLTYNVRFSEPSNHNINYGTPGFGSDILPGGASPAKVFAGRTFTVQLRRVSDNSLYGPLLTFVCNPTSHTPFFDSGGGYWYVNRGALGIGGGSSIEINSSAPQIQTFPAATGANPDVPSPGTQVQVNLIALPPPSYLWGTMERLHFKITQTAGPTGTGLTARRMAIYGTVNALYPGLYLTSSNDGSMTQADATGPSRWMVFDTFAGAPNAPNPFTPFVILRRYNPAISYAGTNYLLQMQYAGADFGPSITFAAV